MLDAIDAMISRVRRLPETGQRNRLLIDVAALRDTWEWMAAMPQPAVPMAAFAIVGLAWNHLAARSDTLEERGEREGRS